MPKVNPLQKLRLKKLLKKSRGNNAKQAMLDAGFAPSTARNATNKKVVKECFAEIAAELRHADITPDVMVKRFEEDRNLAISVEDFSTATRVDEILAKSIAMLTDKTINQTEIIICQDEQDELQRLRKSIDLSIN